MQICVGDLIMNKTIANILKYGGIGSLLTALALSIAMIILLAIVILG